MKLNKGNRKTIAFISHSAGLAGAEQVLYYVLESLSKDLYRPIVFFSEEGPLIDKVKALNVEIRKYTNISQTATIRPEFYLQHNQFAWKGFSERVSNLTRELEAVGADLVYTNTVCPVEGAFAAVHLGLPHIWHIHEKLMDKAFYDWLLGIPFFITMAGILSNRVITVSDICCSELAPYISQEKLARIFAPVKCETYQRPLLVPEDLKENRNKAGIVMACIGTIDRRKAQTDFLDALELMPKDILKDCCVWFAGSGGVEFEAFFSERVDKLSSHINVRWFKHRDDIPALLQASDLLVHPAVNDPFPLVILEAMACGKPVVAARGGGASESVVDNVTGRLVPVRDPRGLAETITDVIRDKNTLKKMGEAARERVRQYDVKNFNGQIHVLLDETIHKKFDVSSRQQYANDFETHITLLGHMMSDANEKPIYEKRINDLLNSWSWRITAPLRKIYDSVIKKAANE